MKRSVQKWMAVILSCCICLSIWSAAALAAGTGEFDPVGNLLPNPGMEEGGQNQNEWTYDKNTFPLNLTTGDDGFAPHSGDSCMGYLQYNSNKPTLIYQEVEIPVSGVYEFSGYFATIAELVTIRIGTAPSRFRIMAAFGIRKTCSLKLLPGISFRSKSLHSTPPRLASGWTTCA